MGDRLAPRHATPQGTEIYRARFDDRLHTSHFRLRNDLWMSSVGIRVRGSGVYDQNGEQQRAALVDAVHLGCNVVDTVVDHPNRDSELVLGQALASIFALGRVSRDEIIVSSHGGHVRFEGAYPAGAAAYVRKNLIESGIAAADEFAQGWHHCIAPKYLRLQLRQSLTNLGLGTLDIYYIHLPEVQKLERGEAVFESRLRAAFAELESQVRAERLICYGITSIDGFRVPPDHPAHLSVDRLVELAHDAGGENHRFRYIQVPFNLTMREVAEFPNQTLGGRAMTLVDAAQELGVSLFGTSTLWGGQLARHFPRNVRAAFPEASTDAQAAIQFARSLDGLSSALVGMDTREQVLEDLAIARWPIRHSAQLESLFDRSVDQSRLQ
jgi:aryl-alcohol dehydrogenase-like predicted oxidoreductase